MNNSIKIKVCGLRDSNNIKQLADIGIDYMGFIFHPKSPRYAEGFLDKETIINIPSSITKTGVFVNVSIESVVNTVNNYSLNAIQLHGDESPQYCNYLKSQGYIVIKAFRADEEDIKNTLINYKTACNFFLFDTPTISYGGSGNKFNWDILLKYNVDVPFFISGGIENSDVEKIKKFPHKYLYGVDINSKFEIYPAFKDVEKVKVFVNQLKNNKQ